MQPMDGIGRHLRAARQSRGWTLRAVEERSNGRFTVAAVGAYERGTRAITAERLAELCRLYGIDPRQIVRRPGQGDDQLLLDVHRIRLSDEIDLARLCGHLASLRHDKAGRYLAVRELDLERVAAARGVELAQLTWQLREAGFAHYRRELEPHTTAEQAS